jgi:NhaP-type Na+/H+ or K+/H+ antiporter/mannitol/fructose-specific phosphotransferase system IIA component (Ntr-type)
MSGHEALLTIIIALFSGIFLIVIAHHLRVPAIVPLLIGGVLLGPHVLNIITPANDLKDGLKTIISMAIAVILFEGGLTLNIKGFRLTDQIIKRLLSSGVLITWFGTAISIYFLFDFSVGMSLLGGSLVIVTGPTVVSPLLRRIRVHEKLQHILNWESIVIDPIGVFITLLCFEWVVKSDATLIDFLGLSFSGKLLPFIAFFLRVSVGIFAGVVGGYILDKLLRTNIIPYEMLNITVLAFALFVFGLCDMVQDETGLLAVTIMGFWLGMKDSPNLKQIKKFKLELTDLAIGLVFVLLAANLDLNHIVSLGNKGIYIVLILIFLIRPIGVIVASYGSELTVNQRLFLSWVAPRGIIAASMASIISLYLKINQVEGYEFFEAFTYSVIGATVIIQGLSAGFIAKLLHVKSPDKDGWLIVGINSFSIRIAEFLKLNQIPVTMIDTNAFMVSIAKNHKLDAIVGDSVDINAVEATVFSKTGNVLAFTDNKDQNQVICQTWSDVLNRSHLYKWSTIYAKNHMDSVGNVVFSDLPKPSVIARELEYGYSKLKVVDLENNKESVERLHHISPLVCIKNNMVSFQQGTANQLDDGINLILERADYYLARVMQEELVIDVAVDDYEDLLTQMMQHVSNKITIIPYDSALTQLKHRELQAPTLIGKGVAVPHSYCPELSKSICMITKIKTPLKLNTVDHQPIKLAFLLLSPPENPKMHLRILSDIAKLISSDGMIDKIINSKTSNQTIHILNEFSKTLQNE